MVLGLWRENGESAVAFFVEQIRVKFPKLKDQEDLAKRVRQVLFCLFEGACFGMVKRISHAVGHSGLGETYRDVRASINTNAVNLIDLSVKLDHISFPVDRLRELKREFMSNPFCDRLLCHLVVHYLYIFPTSERLKQQVCQELDIPIQRLRGLDVVSQPQKRIGPRH